MSTNHDERRYKIVSEKQCYEHNGISRLQVGRGRNVNLIGFWLLEQRDQGMDQLRDYSYALSVFR